MSSIVIYIFISVLNRAVIVLNVLLAAKLMEPGDFGLFAFFQATSNMVVMLTSVHIGPPISVALARNYPARTPLENTVLVIVFLLSSITTMLISAACFRWAFPEIKIETGVLFWFVLFSGTLSIQLLTTTALLARNRRLVSAITNLAGAGSLSIILVLFSSLTVAEALRWTTICLSIGTTIGVISLLSCGIDINVRYIFRSIFCYLDKNGQKIFIYAMLSLVSSLSMQFSLWLLQRQLLTNGGASSVAVYSISNQFYNVVVFLPGVVGPLLLRNLAIMPSDRGQARKAAAFGIVASALSALGVLIFVEICPYVIMILPPKYRIGIEPLTLAVAAGALMFAKFPFSVFFQAKMTGAPEAYASVAAALLLVGGAWLPSISNNAVDSLWLRAFAHAVQAALLIGAFVAYWRSHRKTAQWKH